MLKENEFIRVSDLMEAINQHPADVAALLTTIQSVSREDILAEMWHDNTMERPKKSGTYLIKTESMVYPGVYYYAYIDYSKKYNLWNFFDNFSQEDAEGKEEYLVDYWTEVKP